MKTILACTVGGSPDPICAAIKDHQPDLIFFLVSPSSRTNIEQPFVIHEKSHKSIAEQAGINKEIYTIIQLDDPDDITGCYRTIFAVLDQLKLEHPEAHRIADYTGGTKTMTAAMAMAVISTDWELSLVKGARKGLSQVVPGTEIAQRVDPRELRAHLAFVEVVHLFNNCDYAPAALRLEGFLRNGGLSNSFAQQLQDLVGICRGLDAWDHFDHQRAYALLDSFQSRMVPQWIFLKIIAGKSRGNGYETVMDLFANAERCHVRGRFDDAVARLYRMLEMLAQVRLKELFPDIDLSNLDPDLLPESIRPRYLEKQVVNNGQRLKMALLDDFVLLAELNDPFGDAYKEEEAHLLDALQHRNKSILAHGTTPLSKEKYLAMRECVRTFLTLIEYKTKTSFPEVQFPRINEKGEILP